MPLSIHIAKNTTVMPKEMQLSLKNNSSMTERKTAKVGTLETRPHSDTRKAD